MGFFGRLTGRDAPEDAMCPRCGTPAPASAVECTACGWDMREIFHGAYVGSHLVEAGEPSTEERGRNV